jgi:hypothetical protein
MTPYDPVWALVVCGLIGLASGVFGIWSLKNGKTRLKSGRWITRAKEPFGFWINVVSFLILSAVMLLGVIYHILHIPKPN